MNAKEKFHKAFPLTTADILYTYCIVLRGWNPSGHHLPDPSVTGSRNFVLFGGLSDNALRTTVSRERKKQENFRFYEDGNGIQRYKMADLGEGLTRFFSGENPGPSGLTMAVFQFETGQTKARYILKELLRNFGFKMYVQNTYISRNVNHREIYRAAENNGVGDNIFLFDTGFPEGRTMDKLREIYDIRAWNKKLKKFEELLNRYFKESGGDEDLLYRAMYSGAANHLFNRQFLPPLPESEFRGMRTFKNICETIARVFQDNFRKHLELYLSLHGGTR